MDGACADGECQAAPIGHSPTTVGWGGCATQKPLSGFANGRGADRVADADEAASRDALSPINSAKAVQIKRIGKVFDINPDPITTGDVLNKKSAFAAVVDGFLLDHEAALGLATHGKYELWGGDVGVASFLNPARADHLQRRLHKSQQLTPQPWAADLPTKNRCFGANGDEMEWCDRMSGMNQVPAATNQAHGPCLLAQHRCVGNRSWVA